MPTSDPAPRDRAERLAAGLPSFTIRALRVAAGVISGAHGRRRRGRGESFWQFRQFQPGDPVSAIDWRRTAATQDIFIREREWEVAQQVWLWCDRSPSMEYASSPELESKRTRAALITLALAAMLLQGGETVGLLGSTPRTGRGRAMLGRIAEHLVADAPPGTGVPAAIRVKRHAQTVLVGDFLEPLEMVAARVRGLANQEVAGHLVQVLDPAEELLPFRGRIRFVGAEEEGDLLIGRVETVNRRYVRRIEEHREGLADIARKHGWGFLTHRTDRGPEPTLLALHQALSGAFDRF